MQFIRGIKQLIRDPGHCRAAQRHMSLGSRARSIPRCRSPTGPICVATDILNGCSARVLFTCFSRALVNQGLSRRGKAGEPTRPGPGFSTTSSVQDSGHHLASSSSSSPSSSLLSLGGWQAVMRSRKYLRSLRRVTAWAEQFNV